jgi:uncharacterized protein (TIGR02599 family)
MADSPVNVLPPRVPGCRAFSLVEMLVAVAIFVMILLIVTQLISTTEQAWQRSSGTIQAFQSARIAFDTVYRTLSEATLNTYYDYYNASYVSFTSYAANNTSSSFNFVPKYYGRNSELHFISGKALVTAPRTQVTQSIFFQVTPPVPPATGK